MMRKLSCALWALVMVALLALGGAGCTKKARQARHLQLAEKYFAAGDYDRAEIEYINALRLGGGTSQAFGRLGTMYLEDGKLGRAFRLMTMAVQTDTNNLDFHDKLAVLQRIDGKMKESRDEANFVLNSRPDDPEAPLNLADASTSPKDIESSRLRLEKLTVAPAKRAAIDVALAKMALRTRDFKTAGEALSRAKLDDPKFGPLYLVQALYFWAQNDLKQAEESFKTAVELLPARSEASLLYANFKAQNGDVPEAKKILETAAKKTPDYLPATLALAEIAMTEKKYDVCKDYLGNALNRDPDNFNALEMSGRAELGLKNPAQAAAEFEKLARAYNKSPMALYELGVAYNEMGDFSKAIATVNQALAINPNYAEAAMTLAQIKMNRGDLTSAIISLRQLTQKQPQLAPAQLLLAAAYRSQGDLDEALRIYRKLEDAYPSNSQLPDLVGGVYLLEQRRDEARKEFAKSLEMSGNNFTAAENLVDLDIGENKFVPALQRAEKFAEKNSNAPEPSLLVAKVYLAQKNIKQAAAAINRAIETHPDFTAGYVTLANAYITEHQSQPALEITHKLLEKQPDQPAGLMLKATLEEGLSHFDVAAEAYEKVIALNPKNIDALNNLANIYSEHGKPDRAYELARKARELTASDAPESAPIADTLGWICYKRGDYEQALNLCQEAAAKLAQSPDVQLHLGLARYMMGLEDQARAPLQFAADSKEDFPAKAEAKRALAVLAIDSRTGGAEARTALQKRIAEQPRDIAALRRLAEMDQREGKVEKAIANYESILKINPNQVAAMANLAQLYALRADQVDKAFNLAKTAYKLAPDNADILRIVGRLAYQTGDFKWSLNLREENARKRSGDADAQFDLAESAYSVGHVSEAVAAMQNAVQAGGAQFSHASEAKRFLEFAPLSGNQPVAASRIEEALKGDPNYVPALAALAANREQKADFAGAAQTYDKILKRYPDFAPAMRGLAIIYGQQSAGDQRAYDVATKAREVYPDDIQVNKALGIITYIRGDYSRSVQLLKNCALKTSDDAQVLFYLGMAQSKLHANAESKKSLTTALNLKLPDKQAADAKRTLAELK